MEGTQKRKGSPDGNISAKRSRSDNGNSSQGGGFEEELAALRDDVASDKNPSSKWPRPPVPNLNPSADNIVFQQLEVDNYVGLYMYFIYFFLLTIFNYYWVAIGNPVGKCV